jgi:hypothetical protein
MHPKPIIVSEVRLVDQEIGSLARLFDVQRIQRGFLGERGSHGDSSRLTNVSELTRESMTDAPFGQVNLFLSDSRSR